MWWLLACSSPEIPATVWLGGDLHLGPTPAPEVLSALAPLAGIPGIVNLEGALTEHPRADGLRLSNPPTVLPLLYAANIRALSLANNHAEDGPPVDPQRLSDAGLAASSGPIFSSFQAGDLRIGLSAWDLSEGVPSELRASLDTAKAAFPVLIVSYHVTGPPSFLPRPELRAATDIALAAGASVVMAHGTHVLGPVERRGSQLIAWGLGNIAFACDCTDQSDSMLLRVHLRGPKVEGAEVLPIQAGLEGAPLKMAPRPGEILDLLEAIGSPPFRREGDVGWVPG